MARRILVARQLPEAVEARAQRDYDATLNLDDAQYDADELVHRAAGHEALVICSSEKLTPEVIARLPAEIAIVATFSVGFEHIDVPAARERGLVVTNTPDVLTDATADVAFLLLLAAARRASEAERVLRARAWPRWTSRWLLGTEVTGKRLGIFGMGRIGRALAQRARGFEMTVHYHNRHRLPPEQEAGAVFHADPDDMLPHCDFLSMNCPATPETHHWLNAERIARLPDGAIVGNAARGAVVDDDALIAALGSGKLAAGGLDVYEGEPDIDARYYGIENAVLLPHIGSATVETRDAMGFKCLDNLDAFFAGREPPDKLT